jgi:cytochrome P450
MDCGGIILFQPYGDDWRRSRKMLHSRLHSNAVTQYQPIQIAAARTFVRELLRTEPSPDVLVAMIAADFAETILKIVYGISVETEEDKAKYINDPTNLVEMMVEAGTPGRFFVDGLSFRAYSSVEISSITHAI